MGGALRRIAALLLADWAFVAAAGLYAGLVSLRGEAAGLGSAVIGLTGSAYFAGFLAGCAAAPRLVRAGGHRRVFVAGAAASAAPPMLVLLSDDPGVWVAARLAGGFAMGALFSTVESWVNDAAENRFRGALVSIYAMVVQLAFFTGSALLLVAGSGDGALLLAALLFLASAAPLALARPAAPGPPASVRVDLGALWRLSPSAFAGALAKGAAESAMWIVGPLWIARTHGAQAVGVLLPLFVLGGLLAQWPLGRLSDRVDRRVAMAAAAGAAVAGAALSAAAGGRGLVPAALGFLLLGAGAVSSYAVVVAHANDRGARADAVPIASSLLLLYGLAAAAGPLLAAAALDAAPRAGLFLLVGGAQGAWLLLLLARAARRR